MAQELNTLEPVVHKGLEGITAAATQIAEVDGHNGRLTLRGYDVSELSGNVTFEEVAYLLWNGNLPTRTEYDDLQKTMSSARALKGPVMDALADLAPHASGMHMLRMGAAMLSIGYPNVDSLDLAAAKRRAARLQAQMSAIVAHTYRLKNGQAIVEPKPEHGLAAGFLYMLEGVEPEQARVDGLNAYMVAVSEHGLNVSTFCARVAISTDSDMVSGLTAAVGALKGPKHGGVPGPVLDMLNAIGTPEQTDAYIRAEMAAGHRIMGFGHRIYKVRDPRAALLSAAAEKMAALTGDYELLNLTKSVEQKTVSVLEELKPGRELYANVELYAALILHAVGVPSELFTPVFAVGRTAGWTAHMIEQLDGNRIIRPDSIYTGPRGLHWQPMDARH